MSSRRGPDFSAKQPNHSLLYHDTKFIENNLDLRVYLDRLFDTQEASAIAEHQTTSEELRYNLKPIEPLLKEEAARILDQEIVNIEIVDTGTMTTMDFPDLIYFKIEFIATNSYGQPEEMHANFSQRTDARNKSLFELTASDIRVFSRQELKGSAQQAEEINENTRNSREQIDIALEN